MAATKLYAERDAQALDKAGNHYTKHVMAMTSEKLHGKSDIAAELAHRDMVIDQLKDAITTALRGTKFDEYGNHDDDGLIPFGETKTAIEVLTAALCSLKTKAPATTG